MRSPAVSNPQSRGIAFISGLRPPVTLATPTERVLFVASDSTSDYALPSGKSIACNCHAGLVRTGTLAYERKPELILRIALLEGSSRENVSSKRRNNTDTSRRARVAPRQ